MTYCAGKGVLEEFVASFSCSNAFPAVLTPKSPKMANLAFQDAGSTGTKLIHSLQITVSFRLLPSRLVFNALLHRLLLSSSPASSCDPRNHHPLILCLSRSEARR